MNGDLGHGGSSAPLTITDQADRAWPNSTRPIASLGPDDVRDLLPPVNYSAPAGTRDAGDQFAGNGSYAGLGAASHGAPFGGDPALARRTVTAGQLGARPPAGQLVPAGAAGVGGNGRAGQFPDDGRFSPQGQLGPGGQVASGARSVAAVSSWSPLVIASVVIIAAASMMAPLVGTAVGLVLLIALRAVAITGRIAAKRSRDGGGTALSFAAFVLFPVSLLRALIGFILLAPVALLAFCVVVAATIIAVPVHPLPQALAFGAGALVALVGVGPGSSGSRAVLAGMYSAVAKSPVRLAVTYFGVLSICIWAAVTAWYQSVAPAYWPVVGLHAQLQHLPTLRHLLTDVRNSLLNLFHRFGL